MSFSSLLSWQHWRCQFVDINSVKIFQVWVFLAKKTLNIWTNDAEMLSTLILLLIFGQYWCQIIDSYSVKIWTCQQWCQEKTLKNQTNGGEYTFSSSSSSYVVSIGIHIVASIEFKPINDVNISAKICQYCRYDFCFLLRWCQHWVLRKIWQLWRHYNCVELCQYFWENSPNLLKVCQYFTK